MAKKKNKAQPEIPNIHVQEIEVSKIHGAEWNTHNIETMHDASFSELVESVRKTGLIQRILVRPIADGEYEIIDGHRRCAAIRALGSTIVLCDVIEGLTDEEAQIRTAAANIQRLENDPLLEAELIINLKAKNLSFAEIAARIGKSEAYVGRRAQLTRLIGEWRLFAKDHRVLVSCLEEIASFDAQIQRTAFDNCHSLIDEGLDFIHWNDIRDYFVSQIHDLTSEKIPFDTADACMKCPYNTATHALLFPELESKAHCQYSPCFTKNWNNAVDDKIVALRKKGIDPIFVSDRWRIPEYYNSSLTYSVKTPVAYIYEHQGLRYLVFSVAAKNPSPLAKTQEEKEQAKIERNQLKILRAAQDKVRTAITGDNRETFINLVSETPAFIEWAKKALFMLLSSTKVTDAACDEIFATFGLSVFGESECPLSDIEIAEYKKHIEAIANTASAN